MIQRIPVDAIIASSSVAQNETAEARSITYTARIINGMPSAEVPIGRPKRELWEPPLHVFPLKIGTKIEGVYITPGPASPGEYLWQYEETPLTTEC